MTSISPSSPSISSQSSFRWEVEDLSKDEASPRHSPVDAGVCIWSGVFDDCSAQPQGVHRRAIGERLEAIAVHLMLSSKADKNLTARLQHAQQSSVF